MKAPVCPHHIHLDPGAKKMGDRVVSACNGQMCKAHWSEAATPLGPS